MISRVRAGVLPLLCALACAGGDARALDITSANDAPPSAWIVDFGGYGVVEPTYEGSKHYILGFKPQIDVWEAGSREWLTFPNDAVSFALYETSNFRAGAAGALTLQSPYHGEDIDFRLGAAEADLAGGAFAEYYPLAYMRTRIELLQGITGNTGLAANLSADFIWRACPDCTLTLGPRLQITNGQYASDYFSTQNAQKTGVYLPYHAEGGVLSSGAELTGKYDWTKQVSSKFFLDYNQLVGDAADNPRVSLRGTSEQFIFGAGASYKFAVQP
jgi:MipA family protein